MMGVVEWQVGCAMRILGIDALFRYCAQGPMQGIRDHFRPDDLYPR